MAVVAAIVTGRLPRWLRIALVLGLAVLAFGGGLYVYRYATHPTTLTVAVGSLDANAVQLMSAIATRMASNGSPVRLKVLAKGIALEAVKSFSAGEADLAVARADIGDLSAAEIVVVIGVVGGEINHKVVEALTNEYNLAQTRFRDLALADIPQALKSKQVDTLLVVMPVTEKYLAMLRNLFPKIAKQKPTLIPIESAGAIAAIARYYQSYDLPKGTLQGSPPIPDDDMKTLRVPFYLVANKKLSDDVVGLLAKAIMDTCRELLGEYPLLAQLSEPNTDKDDADRDIYIPIHPGASAYFDGNQKTFFDRYGDQIFYGSMLLGTLTSLFAAGWKFMTRSEEKPEDSPLMRLYALTDHINKAGSEGELAEAERSVDEILKGELEKYTVGDAEATETAALGWQRIASNT